jgi:hypothetical protein
MLPAPPVGFLIPTIKTIEAETAPFVAADILALMMGIWPIGGVVCVTHLLELTS